MFTRLRFTPPTYTGNGKRDFDNLVKSVSDYLLSLEQKNALQIDSAQIRAASGVLFPTSQGAASTDPNTLDDYVELQAWTPTDASGAGLVLAAGTAGFCNKIGNTVFAWGEVVYPATADGSNAIIGGLPFTCYNSQAVRGGVTIGFKTESTLATILVINNTKTIDLHAASGGSVTNATMSGDTVYFLAIYPSA